MVRKRHPTPSVGELVIGAVNKIFEYGAYLKLDEYGGIDAYLPWSEVSSKYVKDIHAVLKEGQKVVVKVIRVDSRKNQIDVSLKRVTDSEQRGKLIEFKRAQRAEKMVEVMAQRLGRTLDDAYREVGWRLEDHYGDVMLGFEEVATRGEEVLRELDVPEEWIPIVVEEVRKRIKPKGVKIRGALTITSLAPDGVERIREVLTSLTSFIKEAGDVGIRVYTVGAPRYAIEVSAEDYKIAEKALAEALNNVKKVAARHGVEVSFERERPK
ncbi:MAG: translation initiation factor IF-2 subunit alpha [Zestosphaera sp.]